MVVENAVELCRHLTIVKDRPHRFSVSDRKTKLVIHDEQAEEAYFTDVTFPRKPQFKTFTTNEPTPLPIPLDKLIRLASMTVQDPVRPLFRCIWGSTDGMMLAGHESHWGYVTNGFLPENCGLEVDGLAWEGASLPKEPIPFSIDISYEEGPYLVMQPYEDELRALLLVIEGPNSTCPFPTHGYDMETTHEVLECSGKELAKLFKGTVIADRHLMTLGRVEEELNLYFKEHIQYMIVPYDPSHPDAGIYEAHFDGNEFYALAKRASKDARLDFATGDDGRLIKLETDLSPAEILYPCILK